MIRRSMKDLLLVENGPQVCSIHREHHHDAYRVNVYRRDASGAILATVPESVGYNLVRVEPNEEIPPFMRLSADLAPDFFRLMGMAADELGVLPDPVAARIAALESENTLLRKMLEVDREDHQEHRSDLRNVLRYFTNQG